MVERAALVIAIVANRSSHMTALRLSRALRRAFRRSWLQSLLWPHGWADREARRCDDRRAIGLAIARVTRLRRLRRGVAMSCAGARRWTVAPLWQTLTARGWLRMAPMLGLAVVRAR